MTKLDEILGELGYTLTQEEAKTAILEWAKRLVPEAETYPYIEGAWNDCREIILENIEKEAKS